MCKYDVIYLETKSMKPQDIIKKYELSDKEIEVMQHLCGKQYPKEDILEHFYNKWYVNWNDYMTKQQVSKVLGSLKRKGLIYSVIDLAGWLGTGIRI